MDRWCTRNTDEDCIRSRARPGSCHRRSSPPSPRSVGRRAGHARPPPASRVAGQQCGRLIVSFEASAAQPVSSRHDEAIHQPVALVPSLLEDRDAIVRSAENAISEVFRSHPCHLRPTASEEMVTPWPAVARDDVYRRVRVYEVALRAPVALGREQTLVIMYVACYEELKW